MFPSLAFTVHAASSVSSLFPLPSSLWNEGRDDDYCLLGCSARQSGRNVLRPFSGNRNVCKDLCHIPSNNLHIHFCENEKSHNVGMSTFINAYLQIGNPEPHRLHPVSAPNSQPGPPEQGAQMQAT
jgi:hypothetical protein